jgi:hypothetical protein
LAFPAIFPASATLVEKHEREKREQQGLDGDQRGRDSAALEAVGTALGSIGLLFFAATVWAFLPHHRSWIILAAATCVWAIASVGLWQLRMRL